MSSSRLHTSLTGCSTSLAISTAWRTYSWIGARRPKPPPSIILCITTLSSDTPAAMRGGRQRNGRVLGRHPNLDAVGAHMRGAGLRLHGGVGEKRHRVVGLDASARRAPDLRRHRRRRGRPGPAGASSPVRTNSRIVSVETSPLPQSSQVTLQRLRRALGAPPGIGHHGHRVRHAHDAAHALHSSDRALVDRLQRCRQIPGIARWRRKACPAAARRWRRSDAR